MSRYTQEVAGKGGWSRWVKPKRRGYKMACCDCGLVHLLDFAHVKNARGIFIVFRAKRHNRATAAMRKAKRFRKPITPAPPPKRRRKP